MTTIATTPLLSEEKAEALAAELTALAQQEKAKLGSEDANYLLKLVQWQRVFAIGGRLLFLGCFWSAWFLLPGVLLLALAKIIDNMEIGHNVLHGQYDFLQHRYLNSQQFEWDIACDAKSWQRTHNFEHHTYTNIIGQDRDFGYGLLRLSSDFAKGAKQLAKDYVFFPLLCWPVFGWVLLGNFLANMIRNWWTATVIFCGHFTEQIYTFKAEDCQNESRGQWFYRQMLGSSNFTGPKWLHILTGHLSCQIEHHLFPDLPAWRYPAMAKQVQQIAKRHGIPYNTGSFARQYGTVLHRILRYSLPG
jgi:fatty acid desaturase